MATVIRDPTKAAVIRNASLSAISGGNCIGCGCSPVDCFCSAGCVKVTLSGWALTGDLGVITGIIDGDWYLAFTGGNATTCAYALSCPVDITWFSTELQKTIHFTFLTISLGILRDETGNLTVTGLHTKLSNPLDSGDDETADIISSHSAGSPGCDQTVTITNPAGGTAAVSLDVDCAGTQDCEGCGECCPDTSCIKATWHFPENPLLGTPERICVITMKRDGDPSCLFVGFCPDGDGRIVGTTEISCAGTSIATVLQATLSFPSPSTNYYTLDAAGTIDCGGSVTLNFYDGSTEDGELVIKGDVTLELTDDCRHTCTCGDCGDEDHRYRRASTCDPVLPTDYYISQDEALGDVFALDDVCYVLTGECFALPPDGTELFGSDLDWFLSCETCITPTYCQAHRCSDDEAIDLWLLGHLDGVFRVDDVCIYFDTQINGTPGTIIDEADLGLFHGNCDSCAEGDTCSEDCVSCADCPDVCPDDGAEFISLDYVVPSAECGTCDPGGPIGEDGCGRCCQSLDNTEVCFNLNEADCIAAGHFWFCEIGCTSGDGTDESPCSRSPRSGSVDIPLVSASAGSKHFSVTIGEFTFDVVFNCTTKAYTFTITFKTQCQATGTVTGDCDGVSGVNEFELVDTVLGHTCAGDGDTAHIEIDNVVLHRVTPCP
jgi:hypothetical protein